jgi:hypothetical protein
LIVKQLVTYQVGDPSAVSPLWFLPFAFPSPLLVPDQENHHSDESYEHSHNNLTKQGTHHRSYNPAT